MEKSPLPCSGMVYMYSYKGVNHSDWRNPVKMFQDCLVEEHFAEKSQTEENSEAF